MRKGAAEVLKHPLVVALIGAIWAGYSGYLTGQTTMIARMDAIEKRMDALNDRVELHGAKLRGRTDFMTCAVRHLDAIEGGGRVPDCQMMVPE